MNRVNCPSCDHKLHFRFEHAGRKVQCTRCAQCFRLPKEVTAADAAGETLQSRHARQINFRQQSLALGVLWIFKGLASGAIAISPLLSGSVLQRYGIVQVVVIGCTAPVWLVIGVQTCRKRVGAIRIGLYFEYLILAPVIVIGIGLLLAGVGCFALLGAIVSIICIRQAHRLIRWAAEIQSAGDELA